MRLLIVGPLGGQISAATRIAMDLGAKVAHVDTIEQATSALRAGAKEYISLPPDPELIAAVLAAVCDDERPLIAEDAAMKQVIALADQVAMSDASILING